MWRYECKRHLLYLLCGAVVGMILYFLLDESVFQQLNQSLIETGYHLSDADVEWVYQFRWLLGAVMIASVVNGVLILRYAMIKFNLSGVFLLILFFFANVVWLAVILIGGMILLLPSIIVCIYGMVTIRNAAAKNFRTLPKGDGSEVERVYRLHHEFKDDVAALALKCRKDSDRWTLIYVLGLVALMSVTLIISNLTLTMLLFLAFAFLFVFVFRLRAQSVLPIEGLLYDQCDPLACASAILVYSKRGHRLNLKMNLLFAQCLLFLDDPQLAMDALVLMRRNRGNASVELNYYMLMAEANYQLGDRNSLEHNLAMVRSIRMNAGTAGNLMQQDTIASIQNKIYLMNQDFDQCEAFYRQVLPQLKVRLQQVNAHYYLGLIAFVKKDFEEAKNHFLFVAENGNTTSFRSKAVKYLGIIERMEPVQDQDELQGERDLSAEL